MHIDYIIITVALLMYIPLSGVLLYVWWKHGKNESGVVVARALYLFGSFLLFLFLFTI